MRRLSACIVLWLALLSLAPAWAQDEPPPPDGAPGGPPGRPPFGAPPADAPPVGAPPAGAPPAGAAMAGRAEDRMANLHKRLRITPAQQPQWDAFVQVWRDNMTHAGQLARVAAQAGSATALEDLRALAAAAQARADDVQRLVPPFEALYAALSADQRKLADAAMRDFLQRGMRGAPHP